MQKPENYDSTEAKNFGDRNRPSAGAYVMKIISAKETTTKDGSRPMIALLLDIAEGEFKGNYRVLFDFFKKK